MTFFVARSNASRTGFGFGSFFLSAGLLSLFFGIAVLINPDLIAYLVAIFFVVTGISLLGTWWRLRK